MRIFINVLTVIILVASLVFWLIFADHGELFQVLGFLATMGSLWLMIEYNSVVREILDLK